jgi:tetratricopeptide (TPR) repeat protein
LRVVAPLAYAAVIFAGISLYLYLDYQGVDAHLARAAHAKLRGNRGETIEQYRQALELEDNPHIHKLLGIELANARYWTDALSEFRLAELGGEPDESIPYYIATLLVALNQPSQAALEYQKFLQAKMCTQALPDDRCELASRFISGGI